MKQVFIGAVVILVVAGGYILFSSVSDSPRDPAEDGTEMEEGGRVTGEVTGVNLEQMAFDGPALITVEADDGSVHTIAVPSMGLPLCAAFENIARLDGIEPGDHVAVAGTADPEGRIVPCENTEHYLTVTKEYSNQEVGISFEFSGDYLLEDVTGAGSDHPDLVLQLVMTDRAEREALETSTEPREGPPTIGVAVFENPARSDASVWVGQNSSESNVGLALSEPEEAVVGGANAVHYVVDGLYPTETFVVTHGGYVFLLTGASLDRDSQIAEDFTALVDSITFTPTGEQLQEGSS